MLAKETTEGKPLKVGVVLSDRQAPDGHNMIRGIFGEGLFDPF